jgi:hypothetical protein
MPANTLGTLTPQLVVQRTLELLMIMFPGLNQIARDFSEQKVLYNQDVITRIPSANAISTFDPTAGYVPTAGVTTTDVKVTVNQHKFYIFEFGSQEISSTTRNLLDEQAIPAAYAMGLDIFTTLAGNITAANFPHEFVTALADIDRKTVRKLGTILKKRGVNLFGAYGLLNGDAVGALADDLTIVSPFYNPGADTVRTGQLTNVHGIQPFEFPGLASAQNLLGFAGNPSSLIFVTRVPDDPALVMPDVPIPGKISLVKNPQTGLTCMMRESYNMITAKYTVVLVWMYGTAVGNPLAGQRLVSAISGVGGTIVDT